MNKDLIIKNIKPYLNVRKELLYSDFEKIFSFLERKEQYQVSELLFSIGVELVDDKDSDEAAPESKKTQEEPHESIIVTVKDSTSRSVKKSLNKTKNTFFIESNEYLVELYQKTKNKNVLQVLIQKNEKYIHKQANKKSFFYNHKLDDEDLFQIATIGFIKGCQKFDCSKGYNLLTYATFWISQAIQREIINTGFLIRLPVHKWEDIKKASKMLAKLEDDDTDKISDKEQEKYKKLKILKNYYLNPEYLDAYIGENQDLNIIDTISNSVNCFCSQIKRPEDYFSEKEIVYHVNKNLAILSPREREVIIKRYGLDKQKRYTLDGIGVLFGVTRERIRQIEEKALRKLRKNFNPDMIDFFDDKLPEIKKNNPQYNFKMNDISYVPDIYTIIRRILNLNKTESDYEILYSKVLECLEQNSYEDNSFSHNEIINKIKRIKGEMNDKNN